MNKEIKAFAIKALIVGAVAMSVIQFTHSRVVGFYERASPYQNCLRTYDTASEQFAEPETGIRIICADKRW